VVFYVAFVALVSISVGGNPPVLSAIGPGVAWAGLLFGVMIGAPHLFSDDIRNGAFDALRLGGFSLTQIVGARMISTALLTLGPLLIATLLIAQFLFLRDGQVWRLIASILVAAPIISAYSVFSGALMARRGAGGLVGVLVTLPLLAPVLIFGVSAVNSGAEALWLSPEIRALVGLSLIGTVLGLFGSVAALRTNAE
jgi:heme exporter protein B